MTSRAIADVSVDWQVQLMQGAVANAAVDQLRSKPGASKLATVGYFDTPGLASNTGGTSQSTGAGKVLGIPSDYRSLFPSEFRSLVGDGQVLLAQQTAANLHAEPGSVVTVMRPGMAPVDVTIEGVVDLPYADSLFALTGPTSGLTPQAPPDNVLILPLDQWHALFDPIA